MIKLKNLLSEGINVRKWIKAVDKGKDVVVYDKKGKRYNLQGGDNKSVQVTDHWEDAGRRNVHPEKTWQTLPLSKVKKIVAEGKLTEVDFGKVKLPSTVGRFLNKFVDSMKGANLNRLKRSAILYQVIDASGITTQQLMADIQKIKKELQKGKEI